MLPARRVVVASPENSETPLSDLRSWVTPSRLFFVRNHFDTPPIDAADWPVRLTGLVDRELTFDCEGLQRLPQRTVFATLECAGNGRSFLEEPTHGVQWGAGAIGHAEWTGTPLRLLLERAGVNPEATEVVFTGADRGKEPDHPQTMAFARSLPLEKALHPDTILAVGMNGEPLEPNHGFPVRLIVPGWYGVASVKWLERIHVTDKHFNGYYQSVKYTVNRRSGSGVASEVVGEMQPKSEILSPRAGETLGVGLHRILGVAWAGPDAVEAVEVSVDGGRNWSRADLVGPSAPYSWTIWEYSWRPSQPGPCSLLARAVSDAGKVQPMRHDPLCGGYLIHYCRPIEVEISASWRSDDLIDDPKLALKTVQDVAEERAGMELDLKMRFTSGSGI